MISQFATQGMAANDAVARFNNAIQKNYPGATVANFDAEQNLWLNRNGERFMADPSIFNAKTPWYGTAMKALVIGGLVAATGGAALSALAPGTAAGLGLGSTFAPATYGAGSVAAGAGAAGAAGATPTLASAGTFGSGAAPAVAPATAGAGAAPITIPGLAPEVSTWTGTLAPSSGWLTEAAGPLALGAGTGFGLSSALNSGGGVAPDNSVPDTPEITPGPGFAELGGGAGLAGGIADGLSTSDILKGVTGAALIGGTVAGASGAGGLGTTTTTETSVLSPEQIAYLKSQQALADKQLEFLGQQGTFQQGYLASIQPLLDQQAALMKQQYDAFAAEQNDPVNAQLRQRSNDLLNQQLQTQSDLAPLQKQLLQYQLDQAMNGGRPTPEQIASIDEATRSAYATGSSQISDSSGDLLRQLREELAPSLGLRSTDTPILDRGGFIQQTAGRQLGQLSSSLATANANARLNYPLAQQQVGNATAENTNDIAKAAQDFQAQLAQNAINNRLNLLGAGRGSTELGLSSGIGLASAARGTSPNFGSNTSTSVSDPTAGLSALLGGLSGLTTGLGNLGLFKGTT